MPRKLGKETGTTPGADRPARGCQGCLAAFAPCPVGQGARRAGGGALPVKGDSFRIKRIPLDNPEEKFWGRFDSAPRPLLRPKGGSGPPLETPAGGGRRAELRGTLGRGAREGWESVRGVSTKGEELPRLLRQRLAKRGRLRAPPAAEEASKKEWQRSKFCER